MRTTAQILETINVGRGADGSLPRLLCTDCAKVMDLSGTGMALMSDSGHQGVVGASGPLAAELEDLQFQLGEGPSIDASRANSPVACPDLTVSSVMPWLGFGPAAVEAGVRAVFALPLQVGAIPLGALCLYRATPGSWDGNGTATAGAYADAAVAVLMLMQAQKQPGRALHSELDEPLTYRAEVHQATGFLSVQASVGLAEALMLLRAHAFATGRPLVEVARDVLAGRLRIQPEESENE